MPFLRILARAASRPTPCLTAALLLSVSFAAQADWNVAVGAASSNGAWSGANPDVWTPSATGATVAASEINSRLTAGTPVVINTSGGGAESGDISVNSAVTWAANELTLTAARNIAINANLNGSGTAKLYLRYGFGTGAGGYTLSNGAKVNLPAGGNFSTQLNSTGLVAYTVITDLGVANDATVAPGIMTLQGMNTGLAGNYVLGADIGAIPTEAWGGADIGAIPTEAWGGAGFVPVGTLATGFTGSFDGLGHQINDLWINRPTTSYVGLFGYASGATLRNVGLTTSTISGRDWVGTLLGSGMANTVIDNSYADSGTVNAASAYSGGLAGSINGSISNSHARIGVTGGIGGTSGGLVGRSDAAISNSYAADGLVSSTEAVGGLVGTALTGSIANSYATSDVSGTGDFVGGLVGISIVSISNSYASGAVSGSGSDVGGLAGYNEGTIGGFWNSDVEAAGVGTNLGTFTAVGKTTAQMKQLATFTGAGWDIDDAGGTGKVWRIYDGYTTPLLRGFMTTLNASPDYDGSGAAMTNIAAHTITGAYEPGLVLGAAGSTLTLASTAANAYTASVKGLYSTQQCYDLVLHRSVSTPGSVSGDIALTNPISWSSGTLAINTTGTVTPVAISGTGTAIFDLQAGTWSQVNATLPGFSVYDFRISGGTFIRALSGDGTMIPYLLADSYGMQGMGSSGMLGLNYQLANDIEAGGTANWYAGAAFKPVGTDAGSQFTGSFDGQGHTISGLAINRAGTSYVGLFGYAGDASTLSHVGLLNSSISGQSSVGTLAGFSRGAISYSYADGGSATGGRNAVGGLVGGGASSIGNSYANVAVSGTSDGALSTGIGGLAGVAKNISNSYATGNVSGNLLVGGLAGQSSGAVSNSYATGAVSGNSGGGLIGEAFGGSVTYSYWDKVTTGRATSAGSAASDGKTTAEMKNLATFAAWDVDDAGGSGKVWRIYDGLGYPLLRNFFTATLTATAGSGGKTYDGSTATSLSVTYSTAPNAHLLGTASVVAASAAVGTQATRVVGLYSDQTGYDIAFANGSLTVTAPPAPDPAPPAPTLIVAAPGSTTTLTGTTPVTASPGSTIVIPAGANVVGVAITLAGASGGGAAGPITFKIGSLVLTLNGYTPGTVVSFKKVLVNGVETLVLVVTSGSLTLSGSAGQPLLTLNGTATLTAGTDGTAISFSAGTDGSGSIAVTSGHIVLSMDAFALKKATRAAAPADGKIYAGELASFGADGKITAVRLGSPPGETGGAGDALTLDLAPNLSFAASVPKLDASVARLGMSVQEAMARAAGATLVGTQTNGVVVLEIGGIRIHALPLGAVAIDPDATGGVKLGADGTATVSVQGVVARFAPSVAELGNLAEDAAAAMPGATLAVNADGVLIATVGGLRYALRPDWLSPDTVTQAAGFAAADGGLSYVKNLRAFVLHPACADFAQLAATVEEALPGATATTNADGTVTLALGEKRWTLAPEMALKAAPLGAGTWWAEADGRLWLRHADGTAQGFTVK